VAVQQLHDVGVHTHSPSRLIIRGDARRPAIRTLKKPSKLAGKLPHGPQPQPPTYDEAEEADDERAIASKFAEWHRKMRLELGTLTGDLREQKAAHFRWQSAAGNTA
jgi:hypothetical protein